MSSGMLSSSTRGFGLLGVPFTSRILAPFHFSSSGNILMVLALTTPPGVPMRASFVLNSVHCDVHAIGHSALKIVEVVREDIRSVP